MVSKEPDYTAMARVDHSCSVMLRVPTVICITKSCYSAPWPVNYNYFKNVQHHVIGQMEHNVVGNRNFSQV